MSGLPFQPYDRAFAIDPYPHYALLREQSPICFDAEYGLTFFAAYHDIARLLTDRRLGRSIDQLLTANEVAERRRLQGWGELPNYSRYVRVNLLETEGADHTRLRRLLSRALSPIRVADMRAGTERVVASLLDDLAPRVEMEFLEDLAVPLPVYVIAELLGWPAEERHRLRPWSRDIVRLYEKDATQADAARAETATEEFATVLNVLADARRAEPRDDLISQLCAIEGREDTLSRDELIASCILLLDAGHEATVNAAGNGLLALLRHPAQLARLRQNPELIPSAVEEMLRYDAPLHLFDRMVLEDMEYGGVRLKQGDKVGLLYGSANRDPAAFEQPDVFDIARRPNRHLSFGAATHFCLGAPLVRLELTVLFAALLRKLPQIELTGPASEYRTGLVFRGLKSLQIGWSPR